MKFSEILFKSNENSLNPECMFIIIQLEIDFKFFAKFTQKRLKIIRNSLKKGLQTSKSLLVNELNSLLFHGKTE